MRTQKKRNAKFYAIDSTGLHAPNKVLNNLITDIIAHVRRELEDGTIEHIEKTSQGTEFYVKIKGIEKTLTRAKYRDRIQHILDKYQVVKKIKGYERDIVGYVLERFNGYFKRNAQGKATGKIPSINIKGKSMYYKNPFVTLNVPQKTLSFMTILGPVATKFKGCIRDNFLTEKQKTGKNKVAGHLKFKNNKSQADFMVAYDVASDTLYTPLSPLAWDMNLTELYWMVYNLPIFNNQNVLSMPSDIAELRSEIQECNAIINDRNKKVADRLYRTKDRKKARKRRKVLHRKLNTKMGMFAQEIIDIAIENKYLICVDGVTTGSKTGTFGQDHLIKEMTRRCEDQKIPFYITPTYYTSQRCNKCKLCDENNRKTVNEFKCTNCGHEENAHLNAAKNIAWEGERLYKAGWPCGDYHKWSGNAWEEHAKERKPDYVKAISI